MTQDHLSYWAETTPDRTAIIDDRTADLRELTWREFEAEVNRWANAILAAGVRPGQSVAWCGPNSLEALAITHAARRTGTIAVPIPNKLTADEARYIAEHSEAAVAWTDEGHDHLVPASTPRLVRSENEAATDPTLADPDTRMLLYTSGTTGQPKGALRKVGGAPGQFGALLELIWGDSDHVYITSGPLYHSGPSAFALRAHLLGATVVTQPKFDAENWLRAVERYAVTTTFAAPTPMRRVTALPADVRARYDVSSMRSMIANAAPWTMALKRAYLEYFPPASLWEVYGSTELSVSTVLRPEDHLRKPGSCGQLAPGVEQALFDDDGAAITDPFTEGTLYVRSAGVFDTYFKNQEQFDANRHEGWQTVGDIAYFDDEGYWYICDRRSDLIVSGGVNIYPAEIENVLDDHPSVAEVAVVGMVDEEWGHAVHACVVCRPGTDITLDQLRAFGRDRLAGYKLPKGMTVMDQLPKTGSGKVLKRELKALADSGGLAPVVTR